MNKGEQESEYLGVGVKMFSIADDRELTPILSKPKIMPIKSALARQLEERENQLLLKEKAQAKE